MNISRSRKVLISMPIVMRRFFDYQRENEPNMIPMEASNMIVSACEQISIRHMNDSNPSFEDIKEEFIKEICDRMFDRSDELVAEDDCMKVSRNFLCESMDQLVSSSEYFWDSSMSISNKMIDEIKFQ